MIGASDQSQKKELNIAENEFIAGVQIEMVNDDIKKIGFALLKT